jgi:MoaA/NifB/PqqE/SkfB family radical SAM enzyme
MNGNWVETIPLEEFSPWDLLTDRRKLLSLDLEITARCNNNCRHCFNNLPAGDRVARSRELSLEDYREIISEGASWGAVYCLLSGGEPLLREDFIDLYLLLKRKGLLVTIYTNGTLISREHVELFRKYPPRSIEITAYGVTEETYERVSRQRGSYAAFRRGLDLLEQGGIKVRLKTMALKSNYRELPEIIRFGQAHTRDYFRYDMVLHLRNDRNPLRNEEIKAERLSPEEVVALERADQRRFQGLDKICRKLSGLQPGSPPDNLLFTCDAGIGCVTVGYDGLFRLCSCLWHPECVYDLRRGGLKEAVEKFVPQVRQRRSSRREFLERCLPCPLRLGEIDLCLWCPGSADLEVGELDAPVDYYCGVAHARAQIAGPAQARRTAAGAPGGE